MTDRELLEAAAKAAGYGPKSQVFGKGLIVQSGDEGVTFNPLNDDGDALRLAVKLGLCIKVYTETVIVGTDHRANGSEMVHEWINSKGREGVATRRAIVRAAALAVVAKPRCPSIEGYVSGGHMRKILDGVAAQDAPASAIEPGLSVIEQALHTAREALLFAPETDVAKLAMKRIDAALGEQPDHSELALGMVHSPAAPE